MKFLENKNQGFTLIEVIVYVAIFSVVCFGTAAYIFSLTYSEHKVAAGSEAEEAARRAMEIMSYDIKNSKSIYSPATSPGQLSLETARYLPEGETGTFIDFFVCETRLCVKKESQAPVPITSDSVEVKNLQFTQIATSGSPSVKINLTIDYKTPSADAKNKSSVSMESTVSLRSY